MRREEKVLTTRLNAPYYTAIRRTTRLNPPYCTGMPCQHFERDGGVRGEGGWGPPGPAPRAGGLGGGSPQAGSGAEPQRAIFVEKQ